MNEENFNLSMRKFLKKVGITSQREIEKAVRDALDAGKINGDETLPVSVVLAIPELGLQAEITGSISLK
jgi:hypothetical protein